jgi:hypothetical protein
MSQTIQFVLYFLGINFLCFSLGYLVNVKQQPNPFFSFKGNEGGRRSIMKKIYRRNTSDFFRINLDCSLLILLFKCLNIESAWAAHFIAVVCIWGFDYMTYLFTISMFFRRLPMIKADLKFMEVGLTLLKNKKYIVFTALIILLSVFYYLFFYLASTLLPLKASITLYILMAVGVAIFGFRDLSIKFFRYLHTRAFISPTIHLFKNIKFSSKYATLFSFEASEATSKNIYSNFQLLHKPEIVIISVESLGSIAYKDQEIYDRIKNVLLIYQKKFAEKEILTASSFSTSPQFAGGSWLCVGSLIYGYKMENDVQYNSLFQNQSNFKGYESMIHYFKNQGYRASMIATLGGYEEFDVDWEKVKNAYPMDSFVKWGDIQYSGKLLNSSCAPDQYSLWKGMEIIESKYIQPKISLFSTLNSHCNWHSPLSIEDDYQRINGKIDFETTSNTNKPRKENYVSSIIYQLETVFDYVYKNPDKIYIIFGDHQPPFITSDSAGFETPLFVLSTNKNLIDRFRQEGFNEDLSHLKNQIKHEGFYSLFMKSFLPVYANGGATLPILPNGIIFESKEKI